MVESFETQNMRSPSKEAGIVTKNTSNHKQAITTRNPFQDTNQTKNVTEMEDIVSEYSGSEEEKTERNEVTPSNTEKFGNQVEEMIQKYFTYMTSPNRGRKASFVNGVVYDTCKQLRAKTKSFAIHQEIHIVTS